MAYSVIQLAEAFIQAGELTDALDALNPHLAANPGDDEARRLRAQVLMRLTGESHLRAALADWESLAAPTRDDRFSHALTLERVGEHDAAIEGMYDLLAEDSADERLVEHLFYMLLTVKRYAEARALLHTVPETWGWLERAGDLAVATGDRKDAANQYREALKRLQPQRDDSANAFITSLQNQLQEKLAAVTRSTRS